MKVKSDGQDLVITVDAEERAFLRECSREDDFETDAWLWEYLNQALARTTLEQVKPEEIGALTSAPILAAWASTGHVRKVWAFMDYQTTSVQDELMKHGEARWTYGGPK
jgi:hypothetical protein